MREIETARLRLRPFTPEDLDDMYPIYSNPEVVRYVGKGVRTREETEIGLFYTIEHYRHGFGMWAVVDKMDNKTIGRCGLCFLDRTPEVELGYVLDKPYWGKGLATEASLASLKYGFEEIQLDRIVAIAHPLNLASRRVMEKVGMKYEKDAHYYDTDVVYYAILREAHTGLTHG